MVVFDEVMGDEVLIVVVFRGLFLVVVCYDGILDFIVELLFLY